MLLCIRILVHHTIVRSKIYQLIALIIPIILLASMPQYIYIVNSSPTFGRSNKSVDRMVNLEEKLQDSKVHADKIYAQLQKKSF